VKRRGTFSGSIIALERLFRIHEREFFRATSLSETLSPDAIAQK